MSNIKTMFGGQKVAGEVVTAASLKENGIKVISSDEC
jgi:uncharacterized protein YbbK (DUF523 family)